MPAEESRCSRLLGIPEDLLSVWSTLTAEQCSLPVWSFVKQKSGYSLRVFWRSKDSPAPNNAHPASLSHRKLRSKKRLEQFISKRKGEASESSSANGKASQSTSQEELPPVSENLTHLHDTGSVKSNLVEALESSSAK